MPHSDRSVTRARAAGYLAAAMSVIGVSPAFAQSMGSNGMAQRVSTTGDDAIAILVNDHREIVRLFGAADTADAAAAGAAIAQLTALLTVHNATEENIVYPAIADIAKRPSDAKELYAQQDTAKMKFWELGQLTKGSPEYRSRLQTLAAAVKAHATHEESTEFPALRAAAGSKLAEITETVRTFRSRFS